MKKIRLTHTLTPTRALIVCGALLAVPVTLNLERHASWAQTTNTNYGKQAGQIAGYAASEAKKLNLTEVQKAQIKAIAQKYAPQIRAIATDASLSSEQKKTALSSLRTSIQTEVQAVLTPKQQAQLAALRAAVKKQVTALITEISAKLNLTTEQKAEIKAIMLDARLEGAAIVTDSAASRADKRAGLAALRTKTRGAIMSVLTPEQQSQLEAILNQIRPELVHRATSWRKSGGLGLGLMP